MSALLRALVQRPVGPAVTLIVADRPIVLSSLGDDPSVPAEASISERLRSGWTSLQADLHRILYGGTAALATGVVVPQELTDPTAVRAHLAEALERYALVYGWPPDDVQRRVWAIQTAGNASTVYATVERCQGYGPDVSWPSAVEWYNLCDEIKRAVALVAAGEAAGTVRTTTMAAWEQAQAAATAAGRRVDRALEVSGKASSAAGFGIGLGLVVVAGVAAAVFLGPELMLLGATTSSRRAR